MSDCNSIKGGKKAKDSLSIKDAADLAGTVRMKYPPNIRIANKTDVYAVCIDGFLLLYSKVFFLRNMKIGVIADTHDNLAAISKAVEFFNREGIELLIHAGDFVAPFTEKPFSALKIPLVGVFGNNDGDKLLLREKYREKRVGEIYEDPYDFELNAKKIIVTHRPQIVDALAVSGSYDVVIYGHTHKAVIEEKGNALVINPGECCGYLTGRKTVAILDLEKGEAKVVEL